MPAYGTDRFESGCWLWPRGTNGSGYGVTGKNKLAHRVLYEAVFGPIPSGLCALHKCDTPLCVNPFHIFLGTKADNSADMRAKNRWRNGSTVLCEEDVKEIRNRVASGESQSSVAQDFPISRSQVSRIIRGVRWACSE